MNLIDKPEALTKFRQFHKSIIKNDGKIGTNLRIMEIAYHNKCNFNCEHCFTKAPVSENSRGSMPLELISKIADEAHNLGIYEIDLYGGELLVNPDTVFDLLRAIKSERFYVWLTTNGYFMTQELAHSLAKAGLDRVAISIDSISPEVHDKFRGFKGAHSKAVSALEYVKDAGMTPFVNVTAGHFNIFSEDFENLCKYSHDKGYTTLINIAMPAGSWQGNFDVMIDEADRRRLNELRKKYKNMTRDLWNPFDKEYEKSMGCQTMSKIYITPNGDVLPCCFLHMKLGNLYEQSLKEIVDYGYSIKYFREYSESCLGGENIDFAKKFMMGQMSVMKPVDAKSLFKEDDYV